MRKTDFLRIHVQVSFWEAHNSHRCHWFLKLLVATEKWRGLGGANKVNININETESKIETPTNTFREMNLVFQLIKIE